MEVDNPAPSKTWPYVTTAVLIPSLTVVGASTVAVLRAGDNALLVTQILGFGVTITVALLAFLKSADTREIVNSRMDEFKRQLHVSATAAIALAHAAGAAEGRQTSDARTDALALKTEAVHDTAVETRALLKTHDQWERDELARRFPTGTP